MISNYEFGRRVGYHHTMASRIRNGNRLPSVEKLTVIKEEFGLNLDELVAAHNEGAAAFARLMSREVFNKPDLED